MLYRIFNTQVEVDDANSKWMETRRLAGIRDCNLGSPINPEITKGWDAGRILLDGRIACQVPSLFTLEFGGIEEEIEENMFVEYADDM
jgi:hypothetical protein